MVPIVSPIRAHIGIATLGHQLSPIICLLGGTVDECRPSRDPGTDQMTAVGRDELRPPGCPGGQYR